MKKTFICILVLLLTFTAVFGAQATALAAGPAYSPAQVRQLKSHVETANAGILALIRLAQLTPWNDIVLLQYATKAVVSGAQSYASAIGMAGCVMCVYESYYIDGRWVEIDPLIVINY